MNQLISPLFSPLLGAEQYLVRQRLSGLQQQQSSTSTVTVGGSTVPGPPGPAGPVGPVGPAGPAGTPGGVGFVFTQATPLTPWVITHNLGRRPSVTVTDLAGNVVGADVAYTSLNVVTVTFTLPFAGQAFLN